MRILAVLLVLAGALVPGCNCCNIDPGAVGVEVDRTGGGVQDRPIPPGIHMYSLVGTTIEEYPVSMQTAVFTRASSEGSPTNDEINVNSVEGQPLSCDVSLSYELDPALVPKLYKRFRQPITQITHTYVKQTIRAALQEVMGQHRVADILGKEKAQIMREALKKIETELNPYGFKIAQFTLNEVRAPESIIKAIAEKNSMEQEALRAQNENAKKKYEAEQAVIAAEAEARSIQVKAEAQAKANRLLAESISPALVQYKALEKWNGQLPQVSGGSTPFIAIPPPK